MNPDMKVLLRALLLISNQSSARDLLYRGWRIYSQQVTPDLHTVMSLLTPTEHSPDWGTGHL